MKWQNKGHEFDQVYQNISSKNKFYLFGAGDYGHQFTKFVEDEIDIVGFIDNDEIKCGKNILSYPCFSLNELNEIENNLGIIITMSQYARLTAIEQLTEKGYEKDKDFFVIEEFLSVYYAYKYNKVYFSGISFLPSTICNLKCAQCLNFNPYAKEFYVRDWNDITKDIDLFFKCVDRLMLFHLSGGEPLLYKHTADLLIYIYQNYGNKIDKIRTVTNGTVVPSDEILEKLSSIPIEITVDDYREAVPEYSENFDKLIGKLKEFKIEYYINKVDTWIDLAPKTTDYSKWTEDKLLEHASECNQSWQELRNGKLYNCNYAAYATIAGIAGEEDTEETYDLTSFTSEKKKEFIEFRLGFTTKGYTNFCKKCLGFKTSNMHFVMPAKQVEGEANNY